MAQKTQYIVELGFKTNTENVRKNINELAANLQKISNIEIGIKGSDFDQARTAAKELTTELQNAVNVDTGRLNLNKLTKNLKKSKRSVSQLSAELLKAGAVGRQSFLQMAQAISSAELPMLKVNKRIKDFFVYFSNSVRWQIAQNATNAIFSSISGAFQEAERLDKALNDIRIVTGYNKTAMAQFAKEANRAAKELKTTTKEYAEASLIFYQQGLTSSEVAKRAETVIKLSQVTGDSAKTVSDQMTAIWNNFADGTKTLEYYADAMAKLGADTAASTSEIATSLEKFAAIAETVGLSYETAMASVATVIDKTRQSSEVVGTAFKTIFARVQGLSLDGITDDGVSLNKYSTALEKVGVDILTASGELRDMDAILEDLGEKWNGLGKETQVAVAQVVGGARQYNQILSLMDNWADVQNNINKATSSTGELDKQANIWADSYEAASKRVEEAKARVSENFLNSDDVINLTNAFADLIEWTDRFIESFGGITPLILSVIGVFSYRLLPIFKSGTTSLINNISTLFNNFTGKSEKMLQQTQTEFYNYLDEVKKGEIESSIKTQIELNQKLIKVKQDMSQITKNMSDQERASALATLDAYERSVQAAIKAAQAVAEAEAENKEANSSFLRARMQRVVEKNFFSDNEITSSEQQEAIRNYAKNETATKQQLDEINKGTNIKINPIKKNEDEIYQWLKQEKAELQPEVAKYFKGKKIDNFDVWGPKEEEKLNKQLSRKKANDGNTEVQERHLEILNKVKRCLNDIKYREQEILELNEDQEKKRKESVDTYKKQNAEQIKTLEYGLQYAEIQKSFNQKQAHLTASFGTTQISENLELSDLKGNEKVFYDTIVNQEKQSSIDINQTSQSLAFADDGQNDILENSIQNYEILERKSIDLAISQKKLNQLNKEFGVFITSSQGDFKKMSKVTKENAENFLKLAKEVGLSEKQLNQFKEQFNNIESEEDIKAIQMEFVELEQAVGEVSTGFNNLGRAMYSSLEESLPKEQEALEKKKAALEALRQEKIKLAEATSLAKDKDDEFNKKLKAFNSSVSTITTGVTTVAGAVMGLYSGINSVFNAFEEGMSPGERFLSFLSAVMTMAPTVALGIKAVGAAYAFSTKLQEKENKKQKKDAVETGIAKIMSNLAASIADMNPVGVAAAVAALALIGAAGVGAIAWNKHKSEQQQKRNDNTIEKAQKTNEVAQANLKESKSLNDLTSQYYKLNEAGLDTIKVKKDILDQVGKNIEAYKQYQKEITLTGEKAQELTEAINKLQAAQERLKTAEKETEAQNIKEISQYQREADSLVAETAKQEALAASNAIVSNIELTAKKTSGERTGKAGKIERKVGGVNDSAAREEDLAWNIIDEIMKDSGQSERRKRKNRATGIVQIRTSSSQILIEDYERLQQAAQEMQESTIPEVKSPNTNDTLREILDLLDTHKSQYEQLKEQQAAINEYKVISAVKSLSENEKVTSKLEEVNSFDEYSAYLSNLKTQYQIENGSMNEEQEKAIEDYVNSQEGMSIYATAQQRIKTLGFENDSNFQDFIKSLNDEKLKLFTEVDINTFENQEDIETEINRLQNVADRKEIQIKIGNINSILSTLKAEGMTQEDWDKIAENELFINDPDAFNAFLSKTYNNQVLDLGKDLDIETNKKISSLKREQNFVKKALSDDSSLSEEARKEYKKRLTELNNELIIQEKLRDEQLKYVNSLVKSDIVDIYKEHNKQLETLQKGYSKLSQILEDTFGQDQIKTQEEMIANLKEQKRVLESMSPLDEQEIDLAKAKVNDKLKELGFNPEELEFNGNNSVDILNFLYEELEGAGSARKEYRDNVYEPIKELLDNYDSKVSTKTSREEEIRNKEREIKSANYEKLIAQLELKLELDQDTMLEVDYNFKKLSKTIKGMAESVNLFSDKIKSVSDGFSAYDTFVNNLHQDMLEGNITEAEYVKGLREAREESYKQLEAMESLKEEIINFYGEHLQKASEEIDKYSDRVDHATSVLTQYKTILELTGKSQSNQMKSVLQGAATVAENSLNISQKEFLMFKQQAADAKAALDKYVEAAGKSLDKEDAEYQLLEKRWLDATEKAEESQQNMLEKTQAWGEAMRASVQYNMEEITKELEKAFLSDKYSDFDSLLTAMERRSILQEDYLTKTNQIYETTKMIRTAQQELDKASNAATKQQLKQFIEKTNQLKSQEKLSNVELDIQQKRYDLLLAEIALKDAQNAKSTVRLTRTADGGFGYVYTADENQVNEAQQNYDDAENELYNTQLNAANTYGQKRFQAQQELIQELQALNAQYLNGEISSIEEYQSKSTALIDFYNQKIANSNDIYEKSLEGSLSVASDTLVKDFDFINYTSEQWASVMKTYTDQIQGELSTWQTTISTIEKMAAIDSESIVDTMGEITTSTSNLTEELAKDGGLIDSLETFIETGKGITDKNFANWYKTLGDLTKQYSNLTKEITNAINAQRDLEDSETLYTKIQDIAKKLYSGDADQIEEAKKMIESLEEGDIKTSLTTLSQNLNNSGAQEMLKSLSENKQNAYTVSNLKDTVEKKIKGGTISESEEDKNDSNSVQTMSLSQYAKKAYENNYTAINEDEFKSIGTIVGVTHKNMKELHEFIDNGSASARDFLNKVGVGDWSEAQFNKAYREQQNSFKEEVEKGVYLRERNAATDEVLTALGMGQPLNELRVWEAAEYLAKNGGLNDAGRAYNALWLLASPNYTTKVGGDNPILRRIMNTKQITEEDIAQIKKDMFHRNNDGLLETLFDIYNTWGKTVETTTVTQAGNTFLRKKDGYFFANQPRGQSGISPLDNQIFATEDSYGTKTVISQKEFFDAFAPGFKTGGYTGSWGPEGKMAMLHEKEIVLNKEDTVNLLDSIKLLRSILTTIDLQAANAQFSSLLPNSFYAPTSSGDTLEQNVHIEAHFDNVTDRNEIVEAFNTLVNRASQYANRKK